jgi:translocation and assembly module TamB
MADEPQNEAPRRSPWRHVARVLIGVAVILVVSVALISWYATTPGFENRVRQKVITTLQDATGGRVELGTFRWNLTHLEFEADNLTIHGLEDPGEAPYLHVDTLFVRAKIIAFFGPKIGLNLLDIRHPVFHLIINADGTTNQPVPKKPSTSDRSVKDTIFDLAVDRTQVVDGMALVNQRAIPFHIAANNLAATVTYSPANDHYLASLSLADLTAQRATAAPVHSKINVRVDLGRNQANLDSLEFVSGESRLVASAAVEDFTNPQWHLKANGSIDVREVEALTAVQGLDRGVAALDLKGQGSGTAKFSIDGTARVAGADYRASYAHTGLVDVSTAIHITDTELALTGVRANLREGGSVDAELHLLHWLAPPASEPTLVSVPPSARTPRPASTKKRQAVESQPMQGVIRARLHGIALRSVMAVVTPPRYQDLGFDTAASGDAALDWTGPPENLTAEARVTLAPTGHGGPGDVPMSGSVDAKYFNRNGTVQIAHLEAHTPATEVHVQGALGVYPQSRTSSLQADLTTHNLGEFDRTLIALGLNANGKYGVQAIPIHLAGEAEFHGNVTETITNPDIKGRLVATNFDTVFASANPQAQTVALTTPPPAPGGSASPLPPQQPVSASIRSIHWDRLDASAEYSEQAISVAQASLTRGKTTLHASGQMRAHRLSAARYAYDRESTVNASVHVNDATLTDLLTIAGQNLPVTGTLQLDTQVSGSLENFHGGGHLSIQGGEAYGLTYKSVNADIRLNKQEVAATNLIVVQDRARLTGDGGYDLAAKTFHFTAQGRNVDLSRYPQIQNAKFPLAGQLSFEAQGSGTAQNPQARARLHIQNVAIGNEARGSLEAEAHTSAHTLIYTLDSHLNSARVQASGQTALTGDYQSQAQLTLANLDIEPYLHLLNVQGVTDHSSLAGSVKVSGPLRYPRRLSGDLQLSQFTLVLSNVPLQTDGSMHATLSNGIVHLDPLHITGEDTNLRASGTAGVLDEDKELDLHANGNVNLKIAQTLDPSITSSGHVDFTLDAGGTIHKPELGGQVKFTNVAVALQDLPNGLSKMNGTLVFDQDRLEVQSLTAQTGGGQLSIGGFLSFQQGLYGDLTATGKDIRVRYPQGISSMADAHLRLQGSSNNLLLSGNVLLTRFAINPNLDLASYANSSAVSVPPDPNAPSSHVRLDIHITSSPELDFQNSYAKLAGDVDLRIRGTLATPSVLGHISVTEGNATFAGTKYELQHGDIYFTNPVRIEPVIDLDATAHVEDYDITIGLHGTASKLNPTFRSEPPLPESDIFSLLAMGRTQEEQQIYSSEQSAAGVNSTADALLGGALNATVSSRIQKLFGGGSVKIDPTYANSVGNSTARITVEQQVSKNATLTYATNVNSTAQQLIQGELDITQNLSVVAQRDEAGVFSLVIKIHRRAR